MNTNTRSLKFIAVPLLLVILLLIQIITIGKDIWNPTSIIQALILNSLILIGIYAFRGFEFDKSSSINTCLITFLAGTLTGVLISFVPILIFFNPRLSQQFFLVTIITATVINPIIYSLSMKVMIKSIPVKRYLIIGKQDEIEPIFKEIEEKSMSKITAYRYMNPSVIALEREITFEPAFDLLLIADPILEKSVEAQIEKARREGVEIDYLPNLIEDYLQRIPIEIAEKFKEYYSVDFDRKTESPAKRVMDVFISSLALVVLSPFMIITSLWILIEDGRPIIFKQERIGKDGKPFIMHKFRSMKNRKQKELPKFVTDEQHRILKIGKIMRPIRFDETPQFWDILIGRMSFIGPRPEQPKFVEEYKENIPFYTDRHRLKTGLTGWAQINYQYTTTRQETTKKLSYDLFYIKNRSTLFDLRIILQTLEAVVWKRGAK